MNVYKFALHIYPDKPKYYYIISVNYDKSFGRFKTLIRTIIGKDISVNEGKYNLCTIYSENDIICRAQRYLFDPNL
jgi:hypothetical protein